MIRSVSISQVWPVAWPAFGAGRSGAGLRPRGLILRRGGELVIAALILIQIVRLALLLTGGAMVAPATGARMSPDTSVLSRFDAFFHTGEPSSLAGITNTGSEQLRLFGVRAGAGGGGSAILGLPDGVQRSVGVGEEIQPGLVLRAVAEDHVTVARGTSLSRIDFGEVPVGAASVPPPPSTPQVVAPPRPAPAPAAAGAAVIDPARLIAEAGLRPRMQGLSINGLTVTARGQSAQLKAAGLRAGDVILSVNGIALDGPSALNRLRTDLAEAPEAVIRFERDGAPQTTTVRTRP
ncbi:type II secretion system protein N [Brevundimonas sp.]|uniref:type II secretion system protein N n=1 Tax=Brevundimonas sp. TaxID=1871086 RepID=UPI003AF5D536